MVEFCMNGRNEIGMLMIFEVGEIGKKFYNSFCLSEYVLNFSRIKKPKKKF
jgi:hypothetical protein